MSCLQSDENYFRLRHRKSKERATGRNYVRKIANQNGSSQAEMGYFIDFKEISAHHSLQRKMADGALIRSPALGLAEQDRVHKKHNLNTFPETVHRIGEMTYLIRNSAYPFNLIKKYPAAAA